MSKRILVTGSQGTLGQPLCKELRARGHEVTGADLMHAPDDIRTDVSDLQQVRRTFEEIKPDVVYHLAGEFGRRNGADYVRQLWTANCIGTHNVIRGCLAHNSHLVFASSSEAYGDIADMTALHEDLLDDHLPGFHNEYALTKFTNEQQIKIAIRNRQLRATVLRFFNVYGPGEQFSSYRSVVCQFIYKMLHDQPITAFSKSTRSFLYIDDWTNAVANVLHSLPCDTFNIALTEQVDMCALVEVIKNYIPETQSEITYKDYEPDNVAHKIADVAKASAQLGLSSTVGLAEGIRRTIEWQRFTYGR